MCKYRKKKWKNSSCEHTNADVNYEYVCTCRCARARLRTHAFNKKAFLTDIYELGTLSAGKKMCPRRATPPLKIEHIIFSICVYICYILGGKYIRHVSNTNFFKMVFKCFYNSAIFSLKFYCFVYTKKKEP